MYSYDTVNSIFVDTQLSSTNIEKFCNTYSFDFLLCLRDASAEQKLMFYRLTKLFYYCISLFYSLFADDYIYIFKILSMDTIKVSKFGLRPGLTFRRALRFVGPYLSTNFFQRLSTDDPCWQRVKMQSPRSF